MKVVERETDEWKEKSFLPAASKFETESLLMKSTKKSFFLLIH